MRQGLIMESIPEEVKAYGYMNQLVDLDKHKQLNYQAPKEYEF